MAVWHSETQIPEREPLVWATSPAPRTPGTPRTQPSILRIVGRVPEWSSGLKDYRLGHGAYGMWHLGLIEVQRCFLLSIAARIRVSSDQLL